MTPDEFVKSRQGDWSHLAHLLDQYRRHSGALSAGELEQLGRLYRAATSDLALAQRDFPRTRVALYLNGLVARAHAAIYRNEPLDVRRGTRFFLETFPQLYREILPFILAAFLLFAVPALLSAYAMAAYPGAAGVLGLQAQATQMASGTLWTSRSAAERPGASAFIMQNNIRVTLLAFAGGISLTLFTVYAMISNGLMLGGVMGLAAHYGKAGDLAAFVIGHGVIELSVIFMAGGAGLKMGWAVIHPGLFRRWDALVVEGRKAVRILFGCVPLLVVAGLIEGLFSTNSDIPAALHWAMGLGTGVILYAYLLATGRPGSAARRHRLLLRVRRALGSL